MERETGFEPATSTLARSHSTTELLPHNKMDSATLAYRSFPFPPGASWSILEHNATLSQLIPNAVSFSKVSVAAGCFAVANEFFDLFDRNRWDCVLSTTNPDDPKHLIEILESLPH